jgi:hypothetical protein
MRPRLLTITCAALASAALVLAGAVALETNAQTQQTVRKVDMGDYEEKNADPNRIIGPMAIVNPERTRQ